MYADLGEIMKELKPCPKCKNWADIKYTESSGDEVYIICVNPICITWTARLPLKQAIEEWNKLA